MEEPILRRTWAEIDLDALAHNYQQARRKIGPNVKYLGVVKADAYGHGAIQVSRKLSSWGRTIWRCPAWTRRKNSAGPAFRRPF